MIIFINISFTLAQSEVEVIAKGIFPYTREFPEAELKRLALRDAYFRAVEKGAGLFINHTTSIKNFTDIISFSFTKSLGFVKSYKEISSGIENNSYYVLIKAIVEKGSFSDKNALEAYKIFNQVILNNPTIRVIVNSDELFIVSKETVRANLITLLQTFGYRTEHSNNYEKLSFDNTYLTLELEIKTGSIQTIEDIENVSGIFRASLSYALILKTNLNDKIIYSIGTQISGVGIDEEKAQYNSLIKFIDFIKTDLIVHLPKKLSEIPNEISITFKNALENQVDSLENLLKEDKDIYSVKLAFWDKNLQILKFILFSNPISGEAIRVWTNLKLKLNGRLSLDFISHNTIELSFNNI